MIPTRGDVDLTPILASLPPAWPVVVWDNLTRPENLRVYGRYAALAEVETEFVYTQDDDAICPAAQIARAWKRSYRDMVFLNADDGETPWLGFGSIFRRDLPYVAIDRFTARYGWSDDVLWWADVIVSQLTSWRNQPFGFESLPYAVEEHRMFMQPDHYAEQARIRELCEQL